MAKKAKSEIKGERTDLTTGQVSNFTRVSYQSLYVYVRNFPEFFSPSANQHTPGRRWKLEDLEMVQAIRSLYHERAGTENIRALLAGGWKLQNVQIWTKEFMALMMEQTLTAQEDLKASAQEVITLKRLLEERKRNNEEVQKMWIRLGDVEHELEMTQKAWRLRTVITKAIKKKYHGKLPELYPPDEP